MGYIVGIGVKAEVELMTYKGGSDAVGELLVQVVVPPEVLWLARKSTCGSPMVPLRSGFSSIFSMVPFQFCSHSPQNII